MMDTERELLTRLNVAVDNWNGKIDGAYEELTEAVGLTRQKLTTIAEVMAARRRLTTVSAVAEAKLAALEDPVRRRVEGEAILNRVSRLEQSLTEFQGELQSLHPRLGSVITASSALADELMALHAESSGEIAEARSGASEHYAFTPPRAGGMSRGAQEELARLRAELQEIREAQSSMVHPAMLDSGARFLELQRQAHDEGGGRRPMGTILLSAGLITPVQLETALREQRSAWHRHIGAILVDLGFTNEGAIAQALAAQTGLPYMELEDDEISLHAIGLVSGQLAQHHTCIPVRVTNDTLIVAMANPLDLVALDDLRLAANRKVEPVVASASRIRLAIRHQYPDQLD